jgi:hypothetical protein
MTSPLFARHTLTASGTGGTDVLRKRDKRWPVWIMQFSQVAACLAQVPAPRLRLLATPTPPESARGRSTLANQWQRESKAKAKAPFRFHLGLREISHVHTTVAEEHCCRARPCTGRGRKRGRGRA